MRGVRRLLPTARPHRVRAQVRCGRLLSRLALRSYMLFVCWYFFDGFLRIWVAWSKRGRAWYYIGGGRSPGFGSARNLCILPIHSLFVFSPCRVIALPCPCLAVSLPRVCRLQPSQLSVSSPKGLPIAATPASCLRIALAFRPSSNSQHCSQCPRARLVTLGCVPQSLP